MKITVIGDIMCEPPVLKASAKADGTYNFDGVFEKMRPMFFDADYVIGNLEFPIAGEQMKYTDSFYDFNAPLEFAEAAMKAGIDLTSTVNNHTLDRGGEGMLRTVKALDELGFANVGVTLPKKERSEAYYFELGGVKYAVVAYTYTTNKRLSENESELLPCINYLRNPKSATYLPYVRKKMRNWVDKLFKHAKIETCARIKTLLGMPGTIERADDFIDFESCDPFISRFVSDIKKAKEKADFVIVYPHVGGQFNPEPGTFSKYVIHEAVKAGADVVLASHSHMVQRIKNVAGKPCAFSLGNFNMSTHSAITVKKNLPNYGLAVHLYMKDKELERMTFSITKGVEPNGRQIVTYPIDTLYAELGKRGKKKLIKDVKKVYKFATGKELDGEIIRSEYEFL